ncbi:hypothetical protein [Corynebacterium sp.]|uniref:hypothetical protein n=1 Tax=Corynebacterium sp. TaxID=1720 RepID=UPI0025BBE91A|nr:hypothetical protein [Corynebacterium sp.]
MLTLRSLRDTMSQEAWHFVRRFPEVPAHALAGPDQVRAQAEAAATRDRLGSSQQLQVWSDGECVIKIGPVGDAQVALSQTAGKDRYSLLLSAENAEDDLRGIPVCS